TQWRPSSRAPQVQERAFGETVVPQAEQRKSVGVRFIVAKLGEEDALGERLAVREPGGAFRKWPNSLGRKEKEGLTPSPLGKSMEHARHRLEAISTGADLSGSRVAVHASPGGGQRRGGGRLGREDRRAGRSAERPGRLLPAGARGPA